jgi:hypothetical protein
VAEYDVYSSYNADRRSGVITVEVWDGGEIVGEESSFSNGILATKIKFPYSLAKNESHRLWYAKYVHSDKDCLPYYSVSSPHYVESLILGIHFARDARPRAVWRFQRLPYYRIPGVYSLGTEVTLNRRGHALERFSDLQPGFCYGLGWAW